MNKKFRSPIIKKLRLWGAVCACLGLISTSSNAALFTSLIGDKDCFGLGGLCFEDDHFFNDLGGSSFTDYRSPGEVLGVDEWETSALLFGPSFDFVLDLGGATPTLASIEIRTAGIDLSPGARFHFNGTFVGSHLEAPVLINSVATLNFQVPLDLISNPGNNLTLSFEDSSNEGFIIDYVELQVLTSPVPVPTAMWLFGSGLLGLVSIARRKKAA